MSMSFLRVELLRQILSREKVGFFGDETVRMDIIAGGSENVLFI